MEKNYLQLYEKSLKNVFFNKYQKKKLIHESNKANLNCFFSN